MIEFFLPQLCTWAELVFELYAISNKAMKSFPEIMSENENCIPESLINSRRRLIFLSGIQIPLPPVNRYW
jgi:hypothetical protein